MRRGYLNINQYDIEQLQERKQTNDIFFHVTKIEVCVNFIFVIPTHFRNWCGNFKLFQIFWFFSYRRIIQWMHITINIANLEWRVFGRKHSMTYPKPQTPTFVRRHRRVYGKQRLLQRSVQFPLLASNWTRPTGSRGLVLRKPDRGYLFLFVWFQLQMWCRKGEGKGPGWQV